MSKATAEQVPNGMHVVQRYYNNGQSLNQFAHDKLVYVMFSVPETNAGAVFINEFISIAPGDIFITENRNFIDRTIYKWRFANSAATEVLGVVAFILDDRC